ncbi:MAG: pyridoxal-phosphate dependent enzyme [Ginsengibacter sp.]
MKYFQELLSARPAIDQLYNDAYLSKGINVSMLRLDKIHPEISGNKIFKLYYFLKEAMESSHKTIITFGGAWSNHLSATAYACHILGIKCIGFARGEEPKAYSHTLRFCKEQGMHLRFISREMYKKINSKNFIEGLKSEFGGHTLVPEGGFSVSGVKGAEKIMGFIEKENYTHVCCPVGTATTFTGLVNGINGNIQVIGFSVLKNLGDITERLNTLKADLKKNFVFNGDYHFGGYAKKTNELIAFMNRFYEDNKIPLDFVYTGKMMFGIDDLINNNYFARNTNILCIHTGGLQGNQSLPAGTLNF